MAGGLWWRLDYYLLQPNTDLPFPRLVLILIFALLPHSRGARTTPFQKPFQKQPSWKSFDIPGALTAGILGRQYCIVGSLRGRLLRSRPSLLPH